MQTEPIVAEPEKTLGNVDFVKETESVSEIDPSVAEPEKNIEAKPTGLPYTPNPEFVVTVDEKEYRAATMTRFPFGGPDLKENHCLNVSYGTGNSWRGSLKILRVRTLTLLRKLS